MGDTLGKIYLFFIFIEVIGLVGFSIETIISSWDNYEVVRMAVLAIMASLSFLYFSLNSIVLENNFEFWASFVIHMLIVIFTIWHYKTQTIAISLGVLIGVTIFQLIFLVMAPFVYKTFGFRFYKRMGARLDMKEIDNIYTIFFTALKMDFVMSLLLLCQATFFLYKEHADYITNSAVIFVTVLSANLGYWGVFKEFEKLMCAFWLLIWVQPGYIVFKLWEFYSMPEKFHEIQLAQFWITGSVAVLVRLVLGIISISSYKKFGYGYKEYTKGIDKEQNYLHNYVEPLCQIL